MTGGKSDFSLLKWQSKLVKLRNPKEKTSWFYKPRRFNFEDKPADNQLFFNFRHSKQTGAGLI